MGVSATVYKTHTQLDDRIRRLSLQHDPESGQWWDEPPVDGVSNADFVAKSFRLGNMATISEVWMNLRSLSPTCQLDALIAFVDKRMTSGEVIDAELRETLASQIASALEHSDNQSTVSVLGMLMELVEESRASGNPIVIT